MSSTLWIHTLVGRDMRHDSEDHSMLYEFAERLDALCTQAGITTLSSFFDTTDLDYLSANDGLNHAADVDPETGYAYGIDDMAWFRAAEGLHTLQWLQQAVGAGKLGALDEASGILLHTELQNCIDHLSAVAPHDGHFHLSVVL